MRRHLRRAAVALVVLAPLVTTCGQNQTAPGAPSVLPSSPATPNPSPSPMLGSACGAGPGSATTSCAPGSPTYQAEVEASISQLMRESPEIFDFKDVRGSNPRVISFGRYFLGLINDLGQRGLCAYYDGDTLQVKRTNAFDDEFTVLASSGYVRRGPNAYSKTCVPARFPLGTATPPPSVPGCALGGSVALACSVETPLYLSVMQAAIKQVTQDHPDFFDFNDIQSGSGDGYKVLNPDGYIKAVQEVLQGQGFCTFYTTDVLMKKDNILSEAYHIMTGSLHIRRDLGSYQDTCYPAAF